MKFKEFGFLDDIQKHGWKVAMWNRSFLFCSWLMRIQGANGLSVTFADEDSVTFSDEDNG